MTDKTKRLIITLDGGMIAGLLCDGIDLTDVTVLILDHDTDCADDDDLVRFGGEEVALYVTDIEQAGMSTSIEARRVYDQWSEIYDSDEEEDED